MNRSNRSTDRLYSSMRFEGDGVTTRVPLTFDLRKGDGLAVDFGEGLVTEGYIIDFEVTPTVVIFKEPLPKGKTVTIRRLVYIGKVKHVFQWTGNAQGGADFSALNLDENFEQIVRASQDAMDAQMLATETLEEMAGIRDTAIDARDKAKVSEGNAKSSETNAKDSETNASKSASEAKDSENLAYKWANNPEDAPVRDEEYSAYHWSKKAESSAGGLTPSVVEELNKKADLTYVDDSLETKLDKASVVNEWGASPEKVLSQGFIKNNLGYVTPEMFGATGDGLTDDTPYLKRVISYCNDNKGTILKLSKSYLIKEDINLRGIYVDGTSSSIVCSGGTVYIGGNSNRHVNPDQSFGTIQGNVPEWNPDNIVKPHVILKGSKNQNISLGVVGYIKIYAGAGNTESSIAYNIIGIKFFTHLELDGLNSSSWINENIFNLNRGIKLSIKGDYQHNNNKFIGGVFEDERSVIDIQSGSNNVFKIRAEGRRPLKLGVNTSFNTVEYEYIGGVVGVSNTLNVQDSGKYNTVSTRYDLTHAVSNYIYDLQTAKYNRKLGSTTRGSRYFKTGSGNNVCFNIPNIYFKCNNDILQLYPSADLGYQYRLIMQIKGVDGRVLTDADVEVGEFASYNSSLKRWEFLIQGDLPLGRTIVVNSNTYEDVVLSFMMNTTANPKESASAYGFKLRHLSKDNTLYKGTSTNMVTDRPTEFVGLAGEVFTNASTGVKYTAVKADFHEVVSFDSTSITLRDASNIAVNDRVLLYDTAAESVWLSVDTVVGNTITVRGSFTTVDPTIFIMRIV